MSGLEITKIYTENTQQQTSSASVSQSAQSNTIFDKNDIDIDKFCKLYGISRNQYDILVNQYGTGITSQSETYIIEKLQESFPNEFGIAQTVLAATEQIAQPQAFSPTEQEFDFSAFEEKPLDEKINIYSEELAKNLFLYGSYDNEGNYISHTLDEWENLSDSDKNQFIESQKSFVLDKIYYIQDERLRNPILRSMMTDLALANFQGMSIDKFYQQNKDFKNEKSHEFILRTDEPIYSGYKNNSTENSEALLYALRQIKESNPDLYSSTISSNSKLSDLLTENTSFSLSNIEIADYLNAFDLDKNQIKQQYLTSKQEHDGLTKPQTLELHVLNSLNAINNKAKDGESANALDNFYNSVYGQYWDYLTFEEQQYAINAYVDTLPDNCEEKEALLDALLENNIRVTVEVHADMISQSDSDEQSAWAGSANEGVQILNAANISKFDKKNSQLVANNTVKHYSNNPEFAIATTELMVNSADNEHKVYISKPLASSGITDIERINYNGAFGEDVDAATQIVIVSDTLLYSQPEVATEAAKNIDKTYEENQIELAQLAIQNKNYNNAMIEDGTFARCAEANQAQIIEMHKARCAQDDYTPEESGKMLSTLSEWSSSNNKTSSSSSSATSSSATTTSSGAYVTNSSQTTQTAQTAQTAPFAQVNQTVAAPQTDAQKIADKLDTLEDAISYEDAVKIFDKLSSTEQLEVLKTLSAKQIAKLPVKLCETFPEFIPTLVNNNKGPEIISTCSALTADIAIRCMKMGSNETKLALMEYIISHPERFNKVSNEKAAKMVGDMPNKTPSKPIYFRA